MVKIFVEGVNDKRFIENLIEIKFDKKKDADFEVSEVGGWTSLKLNKPKIQEFNDAGHHVKIIFDANSDHQARKQHIEQFRDEHNLKFDIFLFPDNESDGDLETLLERIVNNNHRRVLDCFRQHEDCLKKYNDAYKLPTRKSRMYAYVDAFPKNSKEDKRFKRNDFLYSNPEIWDLNSPQLTPLLDFIKEGMSL